MPTDCTVYPICQEAKVFVPATERLLTSIIVCAHDTTRIQRQITSACLGNIEKFTDREDYELILVETSPLQDLNERYNAFRLDKHIRFEENIGMSACMNRGYEASNQEYLYIVFMHNDVFVHEGWLSILKSYMTRKDAVVMPAQGRLDRDFVKKSYIKENTSSNDDAGMIIMTKETFEKTGGWDERFKQIYQDLAFRLRFPEKYICTNKCIITHLGGGTMYASKQSEKEGYCIEAPFINSLCGNEEGLKKNYLWQKK